MPLPSNQNISGILISNSEPSIQETKQIIDNIMLDINKSEDFSGKGKDIFIQNIGTEITKLLKNPDIKDRKQLRDIQLHLTEYLQRRSSTPAEITRYLSRVKTHLNNTYGGKTRKHKIKSNITKKQRKKDRNKKRKKRNKTEPPKEEKKIERNE